jgi:hypothetical protein
VIVTRLEQFFWLGLVTVLMLSAVGLRAETASPGAENTSETALSKPVLSKKEQRALERARVQAQVDVLLNRDPELEDYVERKRCISTPRVRDVQVLGERHVAFRVSRDKYYLVQFKQRCPGLRRGRPVMYETRGSSICTHDPIRALHQQSFGNLEPGVPCYIPGFESVTREQLDGLKALLGQKPKIG